MQLGIGHMYHGSHEHEIPHCILLLSCPKKIKRQVAQHRYMQVYMGHRGVGFIHVFIFKVWNWKPGDVITIPSCLNNRAYKAHTELLLHLTVKSLHHRLVDWGWTPTTCNQRSCYSQQTPNGEMVSRYVLLYHSCATVQQSWDLEISIKGKWMQIDYKNQSKFYSDFPEITIPYVLMNGVSKGSQELKIMSEWLWIKDRNVGNVCWDFDFGKSMFDFL